MELSQTQKQSLVLTQALKQSLSVLQMSVTELQSYINDIMVENPLVDLDSAMSVQDVPLQIRVSKKRADMDSSSDDEFVSQLSDPAQQETFVSHLKQQLPQVSRFLPECFIPICSHIIESLDRRGYLDEPIDLLAASLDISVEDATQALYAVQSLSPTGVGARTLEECLILQLTESSFFNPDSLAIIQNHLEALAKRKFDAISDALGIPVRQVKEYFDLIRSLNPIPSNGFVSAQDENHYVIPEAYVEFQDSQISLTANQTAITIPTINEEYVSILSQSADAAAKTYLNEKSQQVKQLRLDIEKRASTLTRIISMMVQVQKDFLMGTSPALAPLSVQQIADHLELSPSTVSRAIQDKYISVSGHITALKSLLCAQIGNGIPVSSDMLKLYLNKLIAAEDPHHPLSDENLRATLASMGINISRRSVADYRNEFGIATASQRKRTNA